MNFAIPNRMNLTFQKFNPTGRTLECKFGGPRLAINEYLGASHNVTFHCMNYVCKNGHVCDITKIHHGMSLLLSK
jgi:hypothetical protein